MNIKSTTDQTIPKRLGLCVSSALNPAMKSARFLLSIMIPVSLAVTVLKFTGILDILAEFLNPAFSLLGLPGESAIVFITSICLNIYSAIAVISTLSFSGRELTILALMCLISHSLFIETPVQKKTGSSAIKISAVRIIYSFAGAVMLNLILPADAVKSMLRAGKEAASLTVSAALKEWLFNSLFLIVEIMVLVTLLLILQRVLEEFGITEKLTSLFRPFMRIMGLPDSVTFLWIVANTLGLAYGSAIMIEQTETGKLSLEDADILNHHICISHSLLEDTLLFAAIGVPAAWIIFPRIILAIAEVWLLRMRRFIQGSLFPQKPNYNPEIS